MGLPDDRLQIGRPSDLPARPMSYEFFGDQLSRNGISRPQFVYPSCV